jgi:hypothetical protein
MIIAKFLSLEKEKARRFGGPLGAGGLKLCWL